MKVALVTGSTRGIGFEVARELHQSGWLVAINGRSMEAIEAAMTKIDPNRKNLIGLRFDVTDKADMEKCLRDFVVELKGIDALVLNAGVMSTSIIGMLDNDTMMRDFNVNVFSVINMIQRTSKFMIRQKSGSIVLMSSVLGKSSSRGSVVYGATKAAVSSIAKNSAAELGRYGIRVNAVAPGVINTDLISTLESDAIEAVVLRTPLGRLGEPNEVAKLVKFLVSEESNYITGQVIGIDGGYVP